MRLLIKSYILALSAILLAAMQLPSCSSDDALAPLDTPQVGDEANVRITLSTRASSGTGTPANPVQELQVERFNHYWVVFTDGTSANKVVAIVNNTCALTEKDEFSVKLSPGTYKVYGFANISDSYLQSLGIEMGVSMPDLSGTLFTPDNRFFGNSVTTLLPVEAFQADYVAKNNLGIPMTSINGQTVEITNAVTVNASVEVVRMFAKLEFVFKNETDAALTLRSQSVSNLSVNNTGDAGGYIPLYNDDERPLSFLDGMPFKTLTHTYGDSNNGLNLAVYNPSDPNGTTTSRSFYVLESQADKVTNSFILGFNVVKHGESPEAIEDYMRYGMTDANTLTAIRRNDWIRIPITFSDWQMRLEARTYPPIGGYPEAEISETDGNEFKVVFQGGGDFVIRPFIRKLSDGDNWFGIDDASRVVINNNPGSQTPDINIDDPNSLFTTKPYLTATGDIRGRMKVDSGKNAVITITVQVKLTDSTTKTLKRKIYVTQK